MPGFVNAHHHTYSSLARGVTFDKKIRNFYENLSYFWWRWDASLDEESVYYSALLGAIESVRKGVTTIFDHHASFSFVRGSLSVLKEAFERVGIRSVLCFETSDRLGEKTGLEALNENKRFIESGESGITKGVIGLHAGFTVSEKTLSRVKEIVNEYKRPIHIHVSEDRFDRDYVIARNGRPPVLWLYENGVLEHALLAHGIWLDDEELSKVKESEAYIIHNPESNMNNSVGYFNLEKVLNRKIDILLGTDGFSHSILTQFRSAILNAQARGLNGFAIFPKVLVNNFEAAAKLFNAKIGKIEEGYEGDVVGYRYTPFTPMSGDNIFSHIFFDFPEKEAEFVFVRGKPILLYGKFVDIDEDEVKEKARIAADALWKRFYKNETKFRLVHG